MLYPDLNTSHNPEAEKLVIRLKDHARNLYATRQFLCTEAVLVALNRGLGGGLTEDQAITLSAPFCVAMGDSGCLCGALSGAVLAAGLFVGNKHPYSRRKAMRESSLALHHAFKAANGATCCRALTERVRHDKKAHFNQCADLTAGAAETAARLILEKRPDLLKSFNSTPPPKLHNKLSGLIVRLFRLKPWSSSN